MTNQEQYLSEKHLAKRWGISCKTLQRWRWLKMGPSYVRIGGRIRYTPEDIKNFEEIRQPKPPPRDDPSHGNRSSCPKDLTPLFSNQKQASI